MTPGAGGELRPWAPGPGVSAVTGLDLVATPLLPLRQDTAKRLWRQRHSSSGFVLRTYSRRGAPAQRRRAQRRHCPGTRSLQVRDGHHHGPDMSAVFVARSPSEICFPFSATRSACARSVGSLHDRLAVTPDHGVLAQPPFPFQRLADCQAECFQLLLPFRGGRRCLSGIHCLAFIVWHSSSGASRRQLRRGGRRRTRNISRSAGIQVRRRAKEFVRGGRRRPGVSRRRERPTRVALHPQSQAAGTSSFSALPSSASTDGSSERRQATSRLAAMKSCARLTASQAMSTPSLR